MALKRLLHEGERGLLVACPGDKALKHLALVIHRSPEIDHLAVDLHAHLVEVPAPMAEPPHATDPLAADVSCEDRPEPVPPHAHGFMTYVDAALEQQVFHVS